MENRVFMEIEPSGKADYSYVCPIIEEQRYRRVMHAGDLELVVVMDRAVRGFDYNPYASALAGARVYGTAYVGCSDNGLFSGLTIMQQIRVLAFLCAADGLHATQDSVMVHKYVSALVLAIAAAIPREIDLLDVGERIEELVNDILRGILAELKEEGGDDKF